VEWKVNEGLATGAVVQFPQLPVRAKNQNNNRSIRVPKLLHILNRELWKKLSNTVINMFKQT